MQKEGSDAKNKVAKPKSQLYAELLPRLHSGEVELLDDEALIVQLSSLQRRTRSGARDSIDHPPGGHDDLANVLAGVCDAAMHRRMTVGVMPFNRQGSTPMSRAMQNAAIEARRFERDQDQWLKEKNSNALPQEWRRFMQSVRRL